MSRHLTLTCCVQLCWNLLLFLVHKLQIYWQLVLQRWLPCQESSLVLYNDALLRAGLDVAVPDWPTVDTRWIHAELLYL